MRIRQRPAKTETSLPLVRTTGKEPTAAENQTTAAVVADAPGAGTERGPAAAVVAADALGALVAVARDVAVAATYASVVMGARINYN